MIEMSTILYTLGASILILTTSFVGVIFAWRGLRSFFEFNLPYLVSFSAGVFIMVVFSLIEETSKLTNDSLLLIAVITLGALLVHSISILFPGSHHHEDPRCEHEHTEVTVRNMFMGDALHSFVDGVLLAPAFLISPLLGISTTIGILFHELVQELSEFFIYKKSHFSTKKALTWCLYSSITILPGSLIGLYVSKTKLFIIPLLGIAIGSFLYIIFTDLIPDSYRQAKTRSKYILHVLSGLIGVIIMLFIL